MESYDLIVIGGGPGGYRAAERAAQEGMKTLLVEKRAVGGVCLNEGCIPTKAFLHSAKIYRHALDGAAFGISAPGITLDHPRVVEHKDRTVATLVSGVEATLKAKGARLVKGEGKLLGRDGNSFLAEAGEERYRAAHLIVATGSEPVILPLPGIREGFESGFVMSSREILDLREIPKELVVVGGGVIGLEMACYFASAGTKVTVIEMLDRVGGDIDRDFSARLMRRYRKLGMDFRLSSTLKSVGRDSVSFEEKGQSLEVSADRVLLSIGRRPVTAGLGLDTLGIELEHGAIPVDNRMRTPVAGVYAVGDVNGKSMLAHTAYREADVAVNHMTGRADRMRYRGIPSVIYTDPEIASVGFSETSAKAQGLNARSVTLSMNLSGRYMAENIRGDGQCKLVVENGTDRVLGVHLMGSYASELIWGAAMMVETELPVRTLQELVFPHPTVSEILKEALFAL